MPAPGVSRRLQPNIDDDDPSNPDDLLPPPVPPPPPPASSPAPAPAPSGALARHVPAAHLPAPPAPRYSFAERRVRQSIRGAARDGDARGVALRLQAGVPPDEALADGWTALHYASDRPRDGGLAVVRLLLAAGASTDVVNWLGATPLHVAIDAGSAGVARALLAAGASPAAADAAGLNAFHVAAKRGADAGLLGAMAAAARAEGGEAALAAAVNAQTSFGKPPLYFAVTGAGSFSGSAATVDALLALGADAALPDGNADTPLHAACAVGAADIAGALLRAAPDAADRRNADGLTPAARAARAGHARLAGDLARDATAARRWPLVRGLFLSLAQRAESPGGPEGSLAELVRRIDYVLPSAVAREIVTYL